jgi:tRNA uracil 4-sulfurtransferase
MKDPSPSPGPLHRILVLRHGELFLKGQNRGRFEALLERNLRRALGGLEAIRLERGQGRTFVSCAPAAEAEALSRVGRVFGLTSVSIALSAPADLELLSEAALALVEEVRARREIRSFRVAARRSEKRFPLTSPEINRLVGARVVERFGFAVDLESPDLVVGLEVGPVRSFVHVDRSPGAGGLPVGSSGEVALLLSGGIDSPVAGHLLQKRGCTLRAVYFHAFPYTGERTRAKVVRLAALLSPAQGELDLHVVSFTKVQEAIRDGAPAELSVVLYRRAMMRIASALAEERGCLALATGENLGQVASQTLENLSCIERASRLPVLRPLLTNDKADTIALAQRIGTFELSTLPYEDCCSLFVPKHPSTRVRLEVVERVEARLGLEPLLLEAARSAELVAQRGDP